jgi:hypothetical protein
MNRNWLFGVASLLSCFSIRCSGSLVVSVIVSWLLWLVICAFPFVIWMVVFGSKPMNEYWASFFGPSMDSNR